MVTYYDPDHKLSKSQYVCLSKHKYGSLNSALRGAKRILQRHHSIQVPYLCKVCGNYHLKTQRGNSK